MAGIQEILTIGFIIVCIFFIPRLFKVNGSKTYKKVCLHTQLSGKMRLGIVISIFIPITIIFIFKPWEGDLIPFILFGILPVCLGWAGFWVKDGFQSNKIDE